MTWLAPGAFVALILLAGPVIVHLLARRNARRVIFPATHFVSTVEAAAVKPRRLSDVGLLLLRLAIVAVAVLAAARPLVMTPWRLALWNARVSRAVVVDTSRSVLDRSEASRLADQETLNVFTARRVNTPDLSDGVDRAARWLRTAQPARREIVIVSDFQLGSLDEHVVRAIPADIGVRFIRAGAQPATGLAISPLVEGWRGGIWQSTTTIDGAGTRVSWARQGNAAVPEWIAVMASPADTAAADRALRAAMALGIPSGPPDRKLLVRFAGAAPLASPAEPIRAAWIATAALADGLRGMQPGVSVAERDGVMVVDAAMSASALAAPSVVRAALLAVRPATIADTEAEIMTLPDADLARWRRDPAPVTPSALPFANESDLRWLWALALVLLAAEARIRRILRPRQSFGGQVGRGEAHADAA